MSYDIKNTLIIILLISVLAFAFTSFICLIVACNQDVSTSCRCCQSECEELSEVDTHEH